MARKASLLLALMMLLAAGYAIFAAYGWPKKAALFPLAIGIPLLCLAAIEAVWAFRGKEPAGEAAPRSGVLPWVWMIGFLAMIVLIGFPIAVAAFLLVYLKVQAREGWGFSIILTALIWGAFHGLFDMLLHLPFPAGWLLEWLGLAS